MLLPSYLSVGALALTANAFLIPDGNPAWNKEAVDPKTSPQDTQNFKLDCSTCPFALQSDDGIRKWAQDVASDLEMNIESDGTTLKFNGVSFYPVKAPGLPPTLFVSQVKKEEQEAKEIEGEKQSLRLSYSLEYDEKAAKDGASLVTVLMTVMGLDGEMVKIDNLEVRAVKNSDGRVSLHPLNTSQSSTNPRQLMIASVRPVPASPNDPDAHCTNVLCRVFTKLITGIQKAKSKAKAAGHKIKHFCIKCFQRLNFLKHHTGASHDAHRRPDGDVKRPAHLDFADGKPHPHHHHRHHGFFHKMRHIMWRTVKVAFVPILIGIAFGMAASAIGMLVGQMVVFLWMRYRRTDNVVVYERIETDEKEVPPPYEDVPSNEAVTEKEVESKA